MHRSRLRCGPDGGFTLIELLVAITVLAVLAVVSWRGLDQISRATTQNRVRADAVLTVQTALSQWSVDLDSIAELESIVPIDWDGRALRLTRNGSDAAVPALAVVAWTLRTDATGPRWHRWQSLPLTTRAQWQQAWGQAAAWAQDGGSGSGSNSGASSSGSGGFAGAVDAATDTALMPVQAWQVGYFRDGSWGAAGPAPQPAPASPAAQAIAQQNAAPVPDGIRLVIQLPPGDGLAGELTRDWVRPTANTRRR